MKSKKIFCVIVTFNRKEYLIKLLSSLFKQSIKPNSILILDNSSSDGTSERLKDYGFINEARTGELVKTVYKNTNCYYYLNNSNTGGAGGFAKAIEIAKEMESDYLWIMDDDVLPESDCLELLLNGMDDSSKVCIPNRTDEFFNDKACVEFDMSKILCYSLMQRKKYAQQPMNEEFYFVKDMPFEGPLISTDIIKKIGLPNKDYFLLCDDSDYAQRICKHTNIKFITNAVLHRQLAKFNNNNNNNKIMGWRDYYSIRNSIHFTREYGNNIIVRYFNPYISWSYWILMSIYKKRWRNLKVINKAVYDGINKVYGKTINPGEL